MTKTRPVIECPRCGAFIRCNDDAEYDRKVDTDPHWGEPEKTYSNEAYLNDLFDEISREEHGDKTIIRTLRHLGGRITRIEEILGL